VFNGSHGYPGSAINYFVKEFPGWNFPGRLNSPLAATSIAIPITELRPLAPTSIAIPITALTPLAATSISIPITVLRPLAPTSIAILTTALSPVAATSISIPLAILVSHFLGNSSCRMHDYGHAPCSWRPRSRRRSTIPMGVRADQISTTTVVDWHSAISSHGLCKSLKTLFRLCMKEAAAGILL